MTHDIPPPPERLLHDRRLRASADMLCAWDQLRAVKMRERFPASQLRPMPETGLLPPSEPAVYVPGQTRRH